MPKLIAAFQKEYPGVDVELVESSNDVLQKYLLNGTIRSGDRQFFSSHSRHHSAGFL